MGGIMHVTGEPDRPPSSVGLPICDLRHLGLTDAAMQRQRERGALVIRCVLTAFLGGGRSFASIWSDFWNRLQYLVRYRENRRWLARVLEPVATLPVQLFAGALVAAEARRGQNRAAISVIRKCQIERIRREDDPLCPTPATS